MSNNTIHIVILVILIILIYMVYHLYSLLKKNQVDLENVGLIPQQQFVKNYNQEKEIKREVVDEVARDKIQNVQNIPSACEHNREYKEYNERKNNDEPEKVVYYYPQYPNPWMYPNRNQYYHSLYDYYNYQDLAGGYDLYSYNNPYARHKKHPSISINNNNYNQQVEKEIEIQKPEPVKPKPEPTVPKQETVPIKPSVPKQETVPIKPTVPKPETIPIKIDKPVKPDSIVIPNIIPKNDPIIIEPATK